MILGLSSQGIRGLLENPWIIIVVIIGSIGWIILKDWLKNNGKWD